MPSTPPNRTRGRIGSSGTGADADGLPSPRTLQEMTLGRLPGRGTRTVTMAGRSTTSKLTLPLSLQGTAGYRVDGACRTCTRLQPKTSNDDRGACMTHG